MSGPKEPQPALAQRESRGLLSIGLNETLYSSAKVGFWAGSAGVVAGVGGAIVKDTNPFIGGSLNGISWFTLGGTYWFTRASTAKAWGGEEHLSPMEKTAVSAISGTAAGAMVGLLRGPNTIIPGMIFWSLAGAGGQVVANQVAAYKIRHQNDAPSEGFLGSKWSPMTKMSDQEYIDRMENKLLGFEADIALIDERIAALRTKDPKQPGP
jgi:hypothetical protein